MVKLLSVYSKNLNFTRKYSSRGLSSGLVHNVLYYNKSTSWGNYSNNANFENKCGCWDKILKDTIQNNFSKSQKFSRQLPVAEFRSGFVFALHSHFTYDSEIYCFAKLYATVFRTQSNIEDGEIGENKMNSHQRCSV